MLRRLAAALRQLSLFETPEPSEAPGPPEALVAREASGTADPGPPVLVRDEIPPRPAHPPTSPPPSDAPTESGFASLCVGPYARVQVEVGPRLRDSWKVTWTRRTDTLMLRVPPLLAEAPRPIREAALAWAVLVARRTRKADALSRLERRRLEGILREYLQGAHDGAGEGAARIRSRRLAANRRRMERLNPKGACHDLEASLAGINAEYFGGALEARITWASRLGGLSTHRMAEDGEGRPYHLITISRGYDSPEVTPEILGGVVYHECLHIAIPPRREGGRRVVHGRDFRLREREYRHYRVWREWHRTGLPKALRRMMRESRR